MNESDSNTVVPVTTQGAAMNSLLTPASFATAADRETLRNQLRAEEWALHLELITAARSVLRTLHENPHKHTMADLARLADLASKLGRLATEADDGFPFKDADTNTVMVQFEAALKTVFSRRLSAGRPVPVDAIVEVTANVPEKPAKPAHL